MKKIELYTIESDFLLKKKRMVALLTLILPIVGSVITLVLSIQFGIGWIEPLMLAVMFIWTTLGLEVGYHRLFAHKSFKTSRVGEFFWWMSGLMSAQGKGIYWIATHRRHHACSDTPNDPHSPYYKKSNGEVVELRGLKGLWHSHQGNTYTDYPTNVSYYAKDFIRDGFYKKMDHYMFIPMIAFGVIFPGGVAYALTSDYQTALLATMWGGPLRIFIQHQLYFTNGSFAHRYGEKLFKTGDESCNNWVCAIWTFGSALQNTHHAFPSSAYLKQRWYELDFAGFVIKILEIFGIAKDVKKISKSAKRRKLVIK